MNNLKKLASCDLPTDYGFFEFSLFSHSAVQGEITVLHKAWQSGELPWVRVHSSCLTGDIFASNRCDCGGQLHQAQRLIGEKGGLLIYVPQEGRGIGLVNKVKAYATQQHLNLDTVMANEHLGLPIDQRNFGFAVSILGHFGIQACVLLTNNPRKLSALVSAGISVKRQALWCTSNVHNQAYLATKREKLDHLGDGHDAL